MTYNTQTKMIVCDMDGTLAESKQAIDAEMAVLIDKLLETHSFAIISGGSLEQFKLQFIAHLQLSETDKKHLYLMPTLGSALFMIEGSEYREVYQLLLTQEEASTITDAVNVAVTELQYPVETVYGPLVELRGSEVTYSALGQNAPADLKSTWDADLSKRRLLRELLESRLPDFQISIGGTTSLDITRKGVDKAYGIRKLSEHTGIAITDMLYVGDSLYSGGNDTIVQTTGIPCHPVATVADTKELFRLILEAK